MKALKSLTIGLCAALSLISGSFGLCAAYDLSVPAPIVFMVAAVWAFVSVVCYFAIDERGIK
jgi:hypothetical protein